MLEDKLNRFWDIQSMDFEDSDIVIPKEFKRKLVFDETQSKYSVRLPFKELHDTLTDNFTTCQQRFKSLTRNLHKAEDRISQ